MIKETQNTKKVSQMKKFWKYAVAAIMISFTLSSQAYASEEDDLLAKVQEQFGDNVLVFSDGSVHDSTFKQIGYIDGINTTGSGKHIIMKQNFDYEWCLKKYPDIATVLDPTDTDDTFGGTHRPYKD